MIHFEVTQSDTPDPLGIHKYDWNQISIGGPQGLLLCCYTHPPLILSIYKDNYLMIEGGHYKGAVWVNEKKATLPAVLKVNDQFRCTQFSLKILGFEKIKSSTIIDVYKEEAKKINEGDLPAQLIQQLLKINHS